MQDQVFFVFSEGPKIAKNNRKMPIFGLLLQELGQKVAKTGYRAVITIKNGTTFTNKHAVCPCPVYNFQKMAIFHMILV